VGYKGYLDLGDGVTLARNLTMTGGGGLSATGGSASATGVITIPSTNYYSTTFSATGATDVLTIGDGANDLTGGASSLFMDIGGQGTVVLNATSNVIGTWLIGGTAAPGPTLRAAAVDALGAKTNKVSVASSLEVAAKQHVGVLQVVTGARAKLLMGASGGNMMVADSLTMDALSSKLDVGDNAAVFVSQGPGTWSTTAGYGGGGAGYTGLTGMIQYGRNGGTWDRGGGIYTSVAAAQSGYTSLGIAAASDALGIASAATGTWRGETVKGTSTLIAYTYGGDANLDGVINIDDYSQIDGSVAAGGLKGWFNGDFNYDGDVNIDDYSIIDGNIGIQGAPLAPAADGGVRGVTAVPEPAGVVLAGTAVLLGWTRRTISGRRRRRRGPRPETVDRGGV